MLVDLRMNPRTPCTLEARERMAWQLPASGESSGYTCHSGRKECLCPAKPLPSNNKPILFVWGTNHQNISYSSKSFRKPIKTKASVRGKCKWWQKSVKTDQQVKIDFFENLLLLNSKSVELMKVMQIVPLYSQFFLPQQLFSDFRHKPSIEKGQSP